MLALENVLQLLVELWLLAAVVLVLHRLSPRFGIAPLAIFLGALTAVLQFNSLGAYHIELGSAAGVLPRGSFLALPMILFGLLIIYVVNGTTQTRSVLIGVVLVTILAGIVHVLAPIQIAFPGFQILADKPTGFNPRLIIISALAFAIDLIVLIVVYQGSTNLRGRFPSRLAGGLALLAAGWCDALIFPALNYLWVPQLSQNLPFHLAGRTLAMLLLWPLLAFYLDQFGVTFPATAATSHRPALDIFTTTVQLEARDRYHYNLLRTLSQTNQLIGRTQDPDLLFKQVCQQLVANRAHTLAWIGLVNNKDGADHRDGTRPRTAAVRPVAQAGQDNGFLQLINQNPPRPASGVDPVSTAVHTRRAILLEDLARDLGDPVLQKAAVECDLHSLVVLPMRYANQVKGVISVFAARRNAFEQEEIALLQELADDLAYALVNIEDRRQQTVLHAAAETMEDGILIADLQGKIIYANPASADILRLNPGELLGQDINELVPPGETEKVFATYTQALFTRGKLAADFESHNPDGRPFYWAVRASLVNDSLGEPAHAVISIRDITQRRLYEHQLLTLNRLITELVQIHDTQDLLQTLLQAAEELLHANAAGIYLLGPDARSINQTLTHNLAEEYAQRIARDYRGLPGETVLKTMQLVFVEDVLDDPSYQNRIHFMADYGVRSLVVLPIIFQRQLLGAMAVYYPQPHIYQEEELQLGLTLAHTLAITIQNARLYESEHSQRQLAEALVQAATSLNSSLNMDEVLDLILEQTIRVVPCNSTNILMVEGQVAYLARRTGYDAIPLHLRRKPDEYVFPLTLPTLETMISSRKPLLIANTELDPRWSMFEGTEWIKSYAAAPLQVGDQTIGFLDVDSSQLNFFTEETTQRLQAFAAQAAIAIQNARLYRQLQQYASELEGRVRQRTAELQTAKERIEGILSSVPDAVFVLDDFHQLVQANQAGEALLTLAQQHQIELFAPEFLTRLIGATGPSEKSVLEIQDRAYQALASPLPIDILRTGMVIVFRDVTRFREIDQIKTQFVSDVSHELRTPLANLTIYLDLLSAVDDAAKRKSYIETLGRETGRLTHLIEDLLTISRLEAGRMQINLRAVDVNRMITNLAEDRSLMAAGQGLTLRCEPMAEQITGVELVSAQADPLLLNQCLSNLLTNAINYTPAGGTVLLRTELLNSPEGAWVTIHVVDSGAGILPDEMPHIFERFYRGSASKQTGAAGTGLGLAISKGIIERMGGRITFESQPGAGSTFTLWLRPML